MKDLILSGLHPVWLSAGVLSAEEIDNLWKQEIELSVFDYEVETSVPEDLECALSTIREHHPGKNIWVQYLN